MFVVGDGDKRCGSLEAENFGIQKFNNLWGGGGTPCSRVPVVATKVQVGLYDFVTKTDVAHDSIPVKVFKIYGLCKSK